MLSVSQGIVSFVNRSMGLFYQKLIIWTLNNILSVPLKFLQGVHYLGFFSLPPTCYLVDRFVAVIIHGDSFWLQDLKCCK